LPLPKSPAEAGQALPQEGGTLIISVFGLPPSLLGEGGKGDEVSEGQKDQQFILVSKMRCPIL